MPRINVRYYSRFRELTGREAEPLHLDDSPTVGDALAAVMCKYPALLPYQGSLLLARNNEYASPGEPLGEGDTLDVMPPVSGG